MERWFWEGSTFTDFISLLSWYPFTLPENSLESGKTWEKGLYKKAYTKSYQKSNNKTISKAAFTSTYPYIFMISTLILCNKYPEYYYEHVFVRTHNMLKCQIMLKDFWILIGLYLIFFIIRLNNVVNKTHLENMSQKEQKWGKSWWARFGTLT